MLRRLAQGRVTEFMLATALLCYGVLLTTQQYGVAKYIPREEWLGHNCSFVLLLLFLSLTVKGREANTWTQRREREKWHCVRYVVSVLRRNAGNVTANLGT